MPLEHAIDYVAGAYLVFGTLLFAYLALMAAKVTKLRQEVASLAQLLEARER